MIGYESTIEYESDKILSYPMLDADQIIHKIVLCYAILCLRWTR